MMNLIFVSGGQYPFSGAAGNRYMAYAKGLKSLGHDVTFLLFLRQPLATGEFSAEGLSFICTFPEFPDYEHAGLIKKAVLYFKSINRSRRLIKSIHQKNKIDAIILLPILVRDLLPFIRFAKHLNIKILHERTEYPYQVKGGNSIRHKPRLFFYLHLILPQFDGIYVINRALQAYFNKVLNFRVPVEIINMMVDLDRFRSVLPDMRQSFEYIAYCGTLNAKKDGVDILVKGYCHSLETGKISPEIKLLLIGDFEDEDFRIELNNIMSGNDCSDNIIFTGRIDGNDIPSFLCNASALALARPASKKSEGGFPTKLGEYLATGKPVVVTDVGEISLFLTDGYNAFIAKPGEFESISDNFGKIFTDYERALEIGARGRILAETDFSHLIQARKLADFIERICQ